MSHAPSTPPASLARLLATTLLGLTAACATPGHFPPPAPTSAHAAAEGEELWILVLPPGLPEVPGIPRRSDPGPGSGLFALGLGGSAAALTPAATELRVAVEGRIAAVTLEQDFAPAALRDARELELRLALPPGTALDELVVSFGERRIRAVVHERARARELWALAQGRGRRAVLVEEASPGLFVQRLALPPSGERLTLRTGWAQPVALELGPALDLVLPLPLGEGAPGTPLALAATVDAGIPVEALEASALAGFAPRLDDQGVARVEWGGPAPASSLTLAWRVVRGRFPRAVLWRDGEALHLVQYPPRPEDVVFTTGWCANDDGSWHPEARWERFGAREVGSALRQANGTHASLARLDAGGVPGDRPEGYDEALRLDLHDGTVLALPPRPSRLHAAHRVLARAELEALERRAAALDPGDPGQRAELEALGRQALDLALANGLVSPLTELVLVDAASR